MNTATILQQIETMNTKEIHGLIDEIESSTTPISPLVLDAMRARLLFLRAVAVAELESLRKEAH